MNDSNFKDCKQAAVNEMREMNSRSKFLPPKQNPQKSTQSANNHTGEFINIPFLKNMQKDGDIALVLGLILLLMSEKTDKTLLFALMYILL